MNRYLALGCLGLGLMVSPLLSGLSTGAVPTPKIGVIDLDNTLSSTPAGKRANDAFEKTRKAKQAELDKLRPDYERAQKALRDITGSASWRVTKPRRSAKRLAGPRTR